MKLRKFISKAGQMEIIGLVVIVILITLGMLFMALFALKEEPQKKVFTRKGLAGSTMAAIMKTTVSPAAGCSGVAITGQDQPQFGEKVLEDCALYFDQYKGDPPNELAYSDYSCGGKHSCAFFEASVSDILVDTIGKWGKRYEFQAQLINPINDEADELVVIKSEGRGCPGIRDSSGLFPISTDVGLIESWLYVCD